MAVTSRFRRALSTAPPPPRAGLFDRLIGADPAPLAEYKARESRIVREQMGRSKFSDAANAWGKDKLFIATGDLLAPGAASVFPPLDLQPANEGAAPLSIPALFASSRATIVTVAFQGTSQAQLVPWHAALIDALCPSHLLRPAGGEGSSAPIALLNVLYLQGWFWRFAAPIIKRATARAMAAPPAGSALLSAATHVCVQPSAREADHACDALGAHNRLMGHVLLVDAHGHVRWRAHGVPGEGETAACVAAVRMLTGMGVGR